MDGVATSLVSWHTVSLRQTACPRRSRFPFCVSASAHCHIPFCLRVNSWMCHFYFCIRFPVVLEWDGGNSCRCPQLSLEDMTDVTLFPSLSVVWISASKRHSTGVLTAVLPTCRVGPLPPCAHDCTEKSLRCQELHMCKHGTIFRLLC